MATVFFLSNETSDESSGTSGKTIRAIINLIPSIRNMETTEKEEIVANLQPIARKLAHFTLYTIGGIILFLNFRLYGLSNNKKLTFSIVAGSLYAMTDEIHQMFTPRKESGN